MVSPTYLNQHEDLLYRQKYLPTKHWEESHVSNAKYENFGSLRSLAISYMFSVRYYCQKKAMLLTVLEKLMTLHQRPPTRALWEISTGELVFITANDQIAGPYLLKTQELPGALPPGHPAGALRRAHGPNPYIRGRALMHAWIFSAPSPLFLYSEWSCLSLYPDRKKWHVPPPPPPPPAHQLFFEPAEWFKENFKHPP